MTRQEANNLYGWLSASYPRNYKDADPRQIATTIDNLAKVFAHYSFRDVQAEYERVYGLQKNEPHPSDIRKALKAETTHHKRGAEIDPLAKLRQHPKWDEMCRAYGPRACRRAAKLCVETGTMDELKFRLENDTPCTEKDYSEIIAKWHKPKVAQQ